MDSSKVAILVFYGTKLSALKIFEMSSGGQFRRVRFSAPNPIEVYQTQRSRRLDLEGITGFSANSLGPWLGDKTISLVVGEAKEFDDGIAFILQHFRRMLNVERLRSIT